MIFLNRRKQGKNFRKQMICLQLIKYFPNIDKTENLQDKLVGLVFINFIILKMNVNVNIKSQKAKCLKLNNYSNFYLSETCTGKFRENCKYHPYQNINKPNLLDKKTHRRSKTDHGRTMSDSSLTQNNNMAIKYKKDQKQTQGSYRCETLTLIPKSLSQKSHIHKSSTSKSRQKNKNNIKCINAYSNVMKKKGNNPQEKYLSQSLILNNLKEKFKRPANQKKEKEKKTAHKTIKLNLPIVQNNFFKINQSKINKEVKQTVILKLLQQNDSKLQRLKNLISKRIMKRHKNTQKVEEGHIMHIYNNDNQIIKPERPQSCQRTAINSFRNRESLQVDFVNSQLNFNLAHLNKFYNENDEEDPVLTSRTFKNIQAQLQISTKMIQDKCQQNLIFLSTMRKSHQIINILLPFLETGLQIKDKQQKMFKIFKDLNQKNIRLIKFANSMALKGIDVQKQLKKIL